MILCQRSGHTKVSPRSWMPRSQSFLMSSRLPLSRPATSTWQRIWRLQRRTRVAQNRPRFRAHGWLWARAEGLRHLKPRLRASTGPSPGSKGTPPAVGKLKIHAAPGAYPPCLAGSTQSLDHTPRRSTTPTTHATLFNVVGALRFLAMPKLAPCVHTTASAQAAQGKTTADVVAIVASGG